MHSAHTSLTAASPPSSLLSYACSSSTKAPYSSMIWICLVFRAHTSGSAASSPFLRIPSSFQKAAFDPTSICLEIIRMSRSSLFCMILSSGDPSSSCTTSRLHAASSPLRWQRHLHSRLGNASFCLSLAASSSSKNYLDPVRNR